MRRRVLMLFRFVFVCMVLLMIAVCNEPADHLAADAVETTRGGDWEYRRLDQPVTPR